MRPPYNKDRFLRYKRHSHYRGFAVFPTFRNIRIRHDRVSLYFQFTISLFFVFSGNKVDTDLYSLLQGTLPNVMDSQLDARLTLQAIAKLIDDYELRTMRDVNTKGQAK